MDPINVPIIHLFARRTMEGQFRENKRNKIHIDNYSLRLERDILIGRLAVLERRLDREIVALDCGEVGRVYILWFLERVRAPVIKRILEINRILGINVHNICRLCVVSIPMDPIKVPIIHVFANISPNVSL